MQHYIVVLVVVAQALPSRADPNTYTGYSELYGNLILPQMVVSDGITTLVIDAPEEAPQRERVAGAKVDIGWASHSRFSGVGK